MSEDLKILLLISAFTLVIIIIYFIAVSSNNSADSPRKGQAFYHRHCRYRNGRCQKCGRIDPNHEHEYRNGRCRICREIDPEHEHIYDENCICRICQKIAHSYSDGKCTKCGRIDPNHEHEYINGRCRICREIDPEHEHIYDENCICRICQKIAHSYSDGKCTKCGKIDPYHDHIFSRECKCILCGKSMHDYQNGFCIRCNKVDPNHEHIYINGRCRICREIDPAHEHIYHNLYCLICYKRLDCDAIERQLNKKKDDYLGVLRYADNKAVKAELDIIRAELGKLNDLKRDPNYECTYKNGYCTICGAAFNCQAADRKIKELWQKKSQVLYWRSYGGNYDSEIFAIQEEINRLNKLKAENTVYTHDDYDFQNQYQTTPDYSHLFNEKTVFSPRRCPSYPDGCSMCTRDTCLNDL